MSLAKPLYILEMPQACGGVNLARRAKNSKVYRTTNLQTLNCYSLWHLSGAQRGWLNCGACASASRHSSAVTTFTEDSDANFTAEYTSNNVLHNELNFNASDQLPKQLEITTSTETTASPRRPSHSESATGGREPKRLVAMASLPLIAGTTYMWLSAQRSLPPLQDVAFVAAAAGALSLLGLPFGLMMGKAVLGDKFHVEFHRGRLYITHGVPSHGAPLAPGSVRVGPTGDVRGNGAFAVVTIPAGTHVGDYSGDLLDRAAFQERYPDGVGNYAMAIDDEWVLDAADMAPLTATFHPAHMNHSRILPNVGRYYCRAQRRVSFFTLVDVAAGQELLYDYGRAYWYGREHMELP